MPTPKAGYFLKDGTRVPGVTTVLGNLGWKTRGLMIWANRIGLAGTDMNEVRDEAATIGTIAHQMMDDHVHGRVTDHAGDDPTMVEKARVSFGAFLEWVSGRPFSVVETEMQLVSEVWKFGGTPDAVIEIGGKFFLLDYKTSRDVYSDYIVQLSAYWHLVNECRRDHYQLEPFVHLLRVGKNGNFAHYGYNKETIDAGWLVFMNLLEIHETKRVLDAS